MLKIVFALAYDKARSYSMLIPSRCSITLQKAFALSTLQWMAEGDIDCFYMLFVISDNSFPSRKPTAIGRPEIAFTSEDC